MVFSALNPIQIIAAVRASFPAAITAGDSPYESILIVRLNSNASSKNLNIHDFLHSSSIGLR